MIEDDEVGSGDVGHEPEPIDQVIREEAPSLKLLRRQRGMVLVSLQVDLRREWALRLAARVRP